ncbi:MAG: phospho-sugar mutase [Ruminococcaceae bacterium]|nr:phospho-sugar mutase [Oscillospiraceae bacterium]
MNTFWNNYNNWLNADALSDAEKAELISIKDDADEVALRFSSGLSFGTAGLRGTMKVGLNAMNVHTVAHATQGLANLIVREGRAADGVAIACDSRLNSQIFAETAASVLAANGIQVYLFDALRPTPELSFALRELSCVAGINITASHNPKEYNGYKAYWEDGAQLPPEHADTVAAEIARLDIFKDVKKMPLQDALDAGLVTIIGEEIDEKYLAQVQTQAVNPDAIAAVADELKIVYTPLHGTGHRLIPAILSRVGLKHLYTVDEQMVIDGSFPTVKKPNPEYPEAFALGVEIANKVGSDLVIATDPDADRVGVMTRTPDGSFATITGNQMGALLVDYIITAYKETNTMPHNPYVVKSIVTSELAAKICAANGVKMHNVLTGFKFIGEVIKNYEKSGDGSFLFGFEESYGYLKGTYARDKDAVVTAMLICEMTAYYQAKGMTLSDALSALFDKYGFCLERNVEVYMEGLDGPARMAALMDGLRNNPPTEFGGVAVTLVGDYGRGTITEGGEVRPTGLPSSNVLYYRLANGDVIVARPSGTEPKIKFYYMLEAANAAVAEEKLANYQKTLNALSDNN